MKKTTKRRTLFTLRVAAMVGAAYFAVSGISETLGQEREKYSPVYIEQRDDVKATYKPYVNQTEVQPTETTETEEETEEPLIKSLDFGGEEAYMLCKIAMAEAESEGVEGKALVILVILNRTWSDEFPDSVKDVIFQKNQFSPVGNGRYSKVEPDAECYEALKLVQSGWNESQGALYFESKSDSKWHSEHLDFLFQYGRHYFYK